MNGRSLSFGGMDGWLRRDFRPSRLVPPKTLKLVTWLVEVTMHGLLDSTAFPWTLAGPCPLGAATLQMTGSG